MTVITTYTRARTRDICIANIAVGERMHKPTEKQIDEMAASLGSVGQLSPIMVHPVTHQSWRIVAGNTRLLAAFQLKWTHLRADIIVGSATDYKIIELTENAERRSLTAAQRAAAKAELKKLLRERLASVIAAKGGRGNKGGIADEARQLGLPETTARRVMTHNDKPRQLQDFGEVSDGRTTPPAEAPRARPPGPPRYPISVRLTVDERARVEQYNKERYGDGTMSDCLRAMICKVMDDEGY
jgi:ParB/RepB/Spo0J family partition protein